MTVIQNNNESESMSIKGMRLIERDEYLEFIKIHDSVKIENVTVKLNSNWNIKKYQPDKYRPEEWTVWSFPNRGDWATHLGNYRGNWSPYIPRNLIDKFTKPGDLVLDPMVGSGTTLVECKLMQRNCIGVDINVNALMLSFNRLDFRYNLLDESYTETKIELYEGDARNLNLLEDQSVDLIATHPPYAGIISYSESTINGDLSSLRIEDYVVEMRKVAKEFFRVLKPGKYCAILIGDTRKHQHYIPINVAILSLFLDAGFVLKEDIIKIQHNTKTTREKWRGAKYNFYKIAHEHLYILRKLLPDEKLKNFRYSYKWW